MYLKGIKKCFQPILASKAQPDLSLKIGTGTNACYLEEIADIHTIDQNEFKGM